MDKLKCEKHELDYKLFGVGSIDGPYIALVCIHCGLVLEYAPVFSLRELKEYLTDKPRYLN